MYLFVLPKIERKKKLFAFNVTTYAFASYQYVICMYFHLNQSTKFQFSIWNYSYAFSQASPYWEDMHMFYCPLYNCFSNKMAYIIICSPESGQPSRKHRKNKFVTHMFHWLGAFKIHYNVFALISSASSPINWHQYSISENV